MKKKGFGIRLGAYLIDSAFVAFIYVIICLLYTMLFPKNGISQGVMNVAIGISGLLYNIPELLWNSSIGKRILKLEIFKADGTEPNSWQVLFRFLIKNSLFIFILLAQIFNLMFFIGIGGFLTGLVLLGSLAILLKNRQSLLERLRF